MGPRGGARHGGSDWDPSSRFFPSNTKGPAERTGLWRARGHQWKGRRMSCLHERAQELLGFAGLARASNRRGGR